METYDEMGSDGGDPSPNPSAMEDPRADSAAAFPALAGSDALLDASGPNPVSSPHRSPGTIRCKRQVEEPIQMPVYYGRREDFFRVRGEDLVDNCPGLYAENKCAHLVGELPLQPQSMSLVDLQLWIFKLFRLHPETQDLEIKGLLKQYKNDFFDEESSDLECPLDYCPWDTHYFTSDKCWSSFANKLKRKRNVMQKFMLYVQSSEIKHYAILLKAINDDYSQLLTVVLPGTKCLSSSCIGFRDLVEKPTMTAVEIVDYFSGHLGEHMSPAEAWRARQFSLEREYACAIVEGETKESWMWFLGNLERAVVHQSDVCLIHDYKSELIDAMEDLLNSPQRKWRKAESRWCMEDLAENFFAYFGDKELVVMFKKLCQQKRRHKFGKMWKELDELTSKYMLEKEQSATGEMQLESVEHEVAGVEAECPCNQSDSVEDLKEGEWADDNNRKITNFSDWIDLKPREKWSLAYDRGGARYGIMGSDITDLHKNDPVLKGITCLPLSAIVEVTFLRLVKYFENMSAAANKAIGNPSINFPERVQVDMNSKMQKAEMHNLTYTYAADKNVISGEEDRKFTVKGRKREVTVHLKSENTLRMDKSKGSTIPKTATCSCNKPQLLHKPCSHVIAVCCEIGVRSAAYMSPYYSLPYLVCTWRRKFSKFSREYRDIIPHQFRDIIPFERETPTWIPDKRLECGLPACLSPDRIQTAMVEEEQQCRTENGSADHNQGTKTYP
ncbi:hypothetical protein ACQ4PT_022029 [Festuca glaucescens]